MCGICGTINASANESRIKRMVESMHHRGPDDSGVFCDDEITLGMARLAIIDVTPKGHQPMRNHDGSIWIVYNGETYNYKEEREILHRKGYSFKSASDTEVILAMYEEYGDDFLLRMRGMFALAIYDRRKGPGKTRVILARDHLGIKPLLYAKRGPAIVFASEMKSILASGIVEKRFDPESLRLLLTHGSILQPATAIHGVKMLLPGCRMIIQEGKVRIEKYWSLGIDRISNLRKTNYNEQIEFLREELQNSVRLQMVSDVPIGAFLSGGVDSSLLCAMMARECGSRVKTFSVGFENEGAHIDETDEALRIANYLGTDHTRVAVTGKEVREKIFHIAEALDQPTVDGVNSYFVSQAARQGVTVAISGTGGDELFAGYPWFMHMAAFANRKAGMSVSGFKSAILAHVLKYMLFNHLSTGRFAGTIENSRKSHGFISHYARQYQIFGTNGTVGILSREMKNSCRIGREPAFDLASGDELANGSAIERVTALCLRGYTLNQLLRDIDSVSMAHSLEVRVPFLDKRIADVALSLPDKTKLGDIRNINNMEHATYRETGTKRILIDIGRGMLPDDLENQPKRGFGMPFDSWLRGPLKDIMEDTLSDSSIRKRGFFNPQEVNKVKLSFLDNKTSWVNPWLIMIVELWCRGILDMDF